MKNCIFSKKTVAFLFCTLLAIIGFSVYVDSRTALGTDTSFFLDLISFYARGKLFLIDYIDYRIPVFAIFFSWLFSFNLSDTARKCLLFFCIYALYSSVLFFILTKIFRAVWSSFFVSVVCILGMVSWNFDPPRNALLPLFFHTFELISVFIVAALAIENRFLVTKKRFFLAFVAGIFAGLAITGRQNHSFALVFSGLLLMTNFFNRKSLMEVRHSGIKLFGSFLTGTAVSVCSILAIFYVPNTHYLSRMKLYLYDAPRSLYQFKITPVTLVVRLIICLKKIIQNWPLDTPLFPISCGVIIFFLFVTATALLRKKVSFSEIVTKNLFHIGMVVALIGIMVTNIFMVGDTPTRYQTPLFSLASYLIMYFIWFVSNLPKRLKNVVAVLSLLISIFPLKTFIRAEYLRIEDIFNSSVKKPASDQVKEAFVRDGMNQPDGPILILGGSPCVCRAVDCDLYLGYVSDVQLILMTEMFGDAEINKFKSSFHDVRRVIILPDYPNFPGDNFDAVRKAFQAGTLQKLSGLTEQDKFAVKLIDFISSELQDHFELKETLESKIALYKRKSI